MTPFVVPLNILERVDNSTPITDVIQGDPEVNKAKKQAIIDAEEKRVKMMFIIPTILILAVVWVYGIKKL
jgi:predicted nucleic acid-binding Zn ribbon protein